jgi:hypothetical protein
LSVISTSINADRAVDDFTVTVTITRLPRWTVDALTTPLVVQPFDVAETASAGAVLQATAPSVAATIATART